MKSAFVTVGTTKFQELIETVMNEQFLQYLDACGYNALVVQYGKGSFNLPHTSLKNLEIYAFDFKPNLEEYFNNSDLIICHAGAGSIIESLRSGCPHIIVVVNDKLMHNHQIELARKMGELNFALCTNCCGVLDATKKVFDMKLTKYVSGDVNKFGEFLDSLFTVHLDVLT